MTDPFGHNLVPGTLVSYARERWASQSMRDGAVVFTRRGLALVRLDGGGTCWAGSSQLVAWPELEP